MQKVWLPISQSTDSRSIVSSLVFLPYLGVYIYVVVVVGRKAKEQWAVHTKDMQAPVLNVHADVLLPVFSQTESNTSSFSDGCVRKYATAIDEGVCFILAQVAQSHD